LFNEVKKDLLSNLDHPARRIRLTAVEVLESLGPDAYTESTPRLLERLADGDQIVRWASARTLGKIKRKPVQGEIEALARLVGDRDISVRIAAATTLEWFGEHYPDQAAAAVPQLLGAVNVGDADVRIAVIRALGAIHKDGRKVVPVVAR